MWDEGDKRRHGARCGRGGEARSRGAQRPADPADAGPGRERTPPAGPRRKPPFQLRGFRAFDLQNQKIRKPSCLQPLGVWLLVTAATGRWSRLRPCRLLGSPVSAMFAVPGSVTRFSIDILIRNWPMTNNAEHTFIFFLAICVSFSVKYFFLAFCPSFY